MKMTEWLGKRCLLKIYNANWQGRGITECKCKEISPSGNWVKLMNLHGNSFWKPVVEVSLVEVLKDLKAGKPKE